MYGAIMRRRSIRLADLAEEMGTSTRTARRWVLSFGAILPVEIRRGVVIVEEECL
jgi:predicted site-specific integrase-resolvase